MSFPTTPILDDFNRADGAVGGNWSILTGTMVVSGNQVASSGGAAVAYYNAITPGPDCEVYMYLPVLPGVGNNVDLGLRVQDVGGGILAVDGYAVVYSQQVGTDNILIQQFDNVVASTLATFNQDLSPGDGFGMAAVGDLLVARYLPASGGYVDLGSVADNSYLSAGYLTLALRGTTVRGDNFGGGTRLPASDHVRHMRGEMRGVYAR